MCILFLIAENNVFFVTIQKVLKNIKVEVEIIYASSNVTFLVFLSTIFLFICMLNDSLKTFYFKSNV